MSYCAEQCTHNREAFLASIDDLWFHIEPIQPNHHYNRTQGIRIIFLIKYTVNFVAKKGFAKSPALARTFVMWLLALFDVCFANIDNSLILTVRYLMHSWFFFIFLLNQLKHFPFIRGIYNQLIATNIVITHSEHFLSMQEPTKIQTTTHKPQKQQE